MGRVLVGTIDNPSSPNFSLEYAPPFAMATWIIPVPEGLDRRPVVVIYDTFGEEVDADVVASVNTVTITFPSPYTGTAVLT